MPLPDLRPAVLPLLASLLLAAPTPAQEPGDLERLLDGVFGLEPPPGALPGEVLAASPEAFTVASVPGGDGRRGVIAAARAGEGRALAFGHNAFLGDWSPGQGGGETFLRNALAWAAGEALEDVALLVVGSAGDLPGRLGGDLDGLRIERQLPGDRELARFDAVLWGSGDLDAGAVERLVSFVQDGGGLLFGVCPWGRQQLFGDSGRSIRTDLSHNQVAGRLGLVFGFDTAGGSDYGLSPSANAEVHAGRAVERVLAALTGAEAPEPGPKDPADAARLTAALVRALPPGEPDFGPRLRAALAAADLASHVPGPGRSIARSDTTGHLGMLFATLAWAEAAADEVPSAPGHEHFPGAVPAEAERVARAFEFAADQVHPGAWLSTGLYAVAGEAVTVTAAGARGWELRIGAHRDLLWHREGWNRWPEVTLQRPLAAEGATELASPFGGLVYLVPTARADAGARFTIEGAVEAPLYVHGDPGSLADWDRRRAAPAPWGELACDGVVLTVPAGALRGLARPDELMAWWSEAMACYPELLSRPLHPTGRPERLVEDLQISAGWMHSGYPVMTHGADDRSRSDAVDLATLRTKGNWGYFHEFGHNAQDPAWTFDGTGEVTCNLFSLYLGERMCGIEPWENPWLVGQRGKLAPYLAAGADFGEWKREPGLALLTYALVQRDFGWDPLVATLASYDDPAFGPRPRGDLEERSQWMTRLSAALDRDLGPYFEAWGIPTSEAARASLAGREAWLPAELAEVGSAAR